MRFVPPSCVCIVLSLVPAAAEAQQASRPAPNSKPAGTHALGETEIFWFDDTAIGLVPERSMAITGSVLLDDPRQLVFVGADLPDCPIDFAIEALTPEQIAGRLKLQNPTLVSKETLVLGGCRSCILRIECVSPTGGQTAAVALVGDARFSSGLAAVASRKLSDQEFAAASASLKKLIWDPDALADSLTESLSFSVRAPEPLRFQGSSDHRVLFTSALGPGTDLTSSLLVLLEEDADAQPNDYEAYNLARPGVFPVRLANPQDPRHDHFAWGQYPGVTTLVDTDPPQGGKDPLTMVICSVFLPDRVITINAAGPQDSADQMTAIAIEMMESIAFWDDQSKPMEVNPPDAPADAPGSP